MGLITNNMINENERKLLKKITKLRSYIASEVGSSTMDMVNELVELELRAEELSNQ